MTMHQVDQELNGLLVLAFLVLAYYLIKEVKDKWQR